MRLRVTIGWLKDYAGIDEILHTWIVPEDSWLLWVHSIGKIIACCRLLIVATVRSSCVTFWDSLEGVQSVEWLLVRCCWWVDLWCLGGRPTGIFFIACLFCSYILWALPNQNFLPPIVFSMVKDGPNHVANYPGNQLINYDNKRTTVAIREEWCMYINKWIIPWIITEYGRSKPTLYHLCKKTTTMNFTHEISLVCTISFVNGTNCILTG